MSFSISVVKNPIMIWDERRQCDVFEWNESAGDRNLDFVLDHAEFTALNRFLEIKLLFVEQREGETYAEQDERIKREYSSAAAEKGFEMLGRFWYEYADAVFFAPEIKQLRDECVKAKTLSAEPALIAAADKIVIAVDEALKTESGIVFGSD